MQRISSCHLIPIPADGECISAPQKSLQLAFIDIERGAAAKMKIRCLHLPLRRSAKSSNEMNRPDERPSPMMIDSSSP